MIGQTKWRALFKEYTNNGTLPHCIALIGSEGCGKYTLANEIAEYLGACTVNVEHSVEAIREMVATANKSSVTTVYIVKRADELSVQGGNALLKILEEPPKSAYFILTVRNPSLFMDTLQSRCSCYTMSTYTRAELCEYNNGEKSPVFCRTPHDIDLYNQYNDIEEFVQLVIDNVGDVPLLNAMKIGERVGKDNGYDMRFFFEVFKCKCLEKIRHTCTRAELMVLQDWITITSDYEKHASRLGTNLSMVMDMWLLDIRGSYGNVL